MGNFWNKLGNFLLQHMVTLEIINLLMSFSNWRIQWIRVVYYYVNGACHSGKIALKVNNLVQLQVSNVNNNHKSIVIICLPLAYNIGPGLHIKLDCTQGRLYSRAFIYKHKTSTLTRFVKPMYSIKPHKTYFIYNCTCNPLLHTIWD